MFPQITKNVLQEMATWMKSKNVVDFWKEMKRKATLSTSEATCSQIINKLLTTAAQNLLESIDTSADYNLLTETPETTPVSTSAALELDCLLEATSLQDLLLTSPLPSTNQDNTRGNKDNNEVSNNDSKWTFNGTNVTNLFRQYQHRTKTQIADKSSFQVESDLQEILALSNVLFLAPNQHNDLKVQVFGFQFVDSLCHATINRFMDNLEVDFSTQEVSDLAAIMDDVLTRKKLTIDAQLDLLLTAKTVDPVKAAVANKNEGVSNICPDAVISTIIQSKYGRPWALARQREEINRLELKNQELANTIHQLTLKLSRLNSEHERQRADEIKQLNARWEAQLKRREEEHEQALAELKDHFQHSPYLHSTVKKLDLSFEKPESEHCPEDLVLSPLGPSQPSSVLPLLNPHASCHGQEGSVVFSSIDTMIYSSSESCLPRTPSPSTCYSKDKQGLRPSSSREPVPKRIASCVVSPEIHTVSEKKRAREGYEPKPIVYSSLAHPPLFINPNTSSSLSQASSDPPEVKTEMFTQTVVGDWMWKYTRNRLGRGMSENRHLRFFWLHPYSQIVYWSTQEPGVYPADSIKNARVLSFKTIEHDQIPHIVIKTPHRSIKIQCLNPDAHQAWIDPTRLPSSAFLLSVVPNILFFSQIDTISLFLSMFLYPTIPSTPHLRIAILPSFATLDPPIPKSHNTVDSLHRVDLTW
ncbi:hypothetical protein G6F53_010929 [Rhizopus delemar]|nr:hypothetical protein G6F53_010929 [Rhizopus delemar]